jgi:Family of unknown function (DUF6295)
MCTYVTETLAANGSAKGRSGWFRLARATVYYDHPVHAGPDHTMNLDFTDPARGADARVAVELDTASALELMRSMASVLSQVPVELSGIEPEAVRDVLTALESVCPAPVGTADV